MSNYYRFERKKLISIKCKHSTSTNDSKRQTDRLVYGDPALA